MTEQIGEDPNNITEISHTETDYPEPRTHRNRWLVKPLNLVAGSLVLILACTSSDIRPPMRIQPSPTPPNDNIGGDIMVNTGDNYPIDTGDNYPFVSSGLCEQDERGWWYLNGADPTNEAHWIPCIDNT